jgi:hypothetical protein
MKLPPKVVGNSNFLFKIVKKIMDPLLRALKTYICFLRISNAIRELFIGSEKCFE